METYYMSLPFQMICVLRLLIAAVSGLAVGYERKNRMKEAGPRTHLIVAMGAALMMILSKYGFFDLAACAAENALLKVDASRIASQIVSGIGFLGAGMIFVRGKSVSGLTTAAGIWAMAGIGMAYGAGMYILGLAGTAIVLATQCLLHDNRFLAKEYGSYEVVIDCRKGTLEQLLADVGKTCVRLLSVDAVSRRGDTLCAQLCLEEPLQPTRLPGVMQSLSGLPYVKEVTRERPADVR